MPRFPRATSGQRARSRVRSIAAACGLVLLPGAVAAQSAAAPPDAATIQAQLRSWFANILAPAVTLPELPLTVTLEGDKYRLTLPASYWSGQPGGDVTADLRQVEGGAWSIDGLKAPSSGAFSTAALGDQGAVPAGEARYQVGEQDFRAVIDPEMRRRSTLTMDVRDLIFDMRIDDQKQAQRIERYTIQGTVAPAADGRFDVIQDTTMSNWVTTADMVTGIGVEMGIRRARVSMRLDGVRSDRLGTAFTTLKELVAVALNERAANDKDAKNPDAKPAEPRPDLAQIGRQKARALIEAFRDMADRMEGEETVDDFTMVLPMVGKISLAQMQFGMGAEVPDGRLRAWTELTLGGLEAEAIPPNMREYVPSRIALRPVISGVQTERIFNLLLRTLDENPDMAALEAETIALLGATDTVIGLESMAIDLNPLRLTGNGRLRLFGKDKAGFEARLTATGLDALIADASKKPELKMAAPMLVMARGLGRQEGDKLVWDLAISEGQALVNGVDVMAMQPPPEQKPQPQQRPNRR